jgi:hypothetical protein
VLLTTALISNSVSREKVSCFFFELSSSMPLSFSKSRCFWNAALAENSVHWQQCFVYLALACDNPLFGNLKAAIVHLSLKDKIGHCLILQKTCVRKNSLAPLIKEFE